MKNKIVYLIISLALATSIIIAGAVISNYFGKVATFEPVYVKISGVPENFKKEIKVMGYTPEGKESAFRYNDSLKAFHSYYGFLGSIGIQIPGSIPDSVESIEISSGREIFNYNRTDLDTAWEITYSANRSRAEMKTPASFKTKETKVRILVSTRYWQMTKIALYLLFSLFVIVLIIKCIKYVYGKYFNKIY